MRIILLLLILTTGFYLSAGELANRSKVYPRCNIPCYDYKPHLLSSPQIEASSGWIALLPATAGKVSGDESQTSKVFQLKASEIRKDHCALSNCVVTIWKDGRYLVNFTATQDPTSVPPEFRPQLERFIQNKFKVVVRCEGDFNEYDNPLTMQLGKPQLAEITLADFWLKRGEVKNWRYSSPCECKTIKDNFPAINRVSVELRYE